MQNRFFLNTISLGTYIIFVRFICIIYQNKLVLTITLLFNVVIKKIYIKLKNNMPIVM